MSSNINTESQNNGQIKNLRISPKKRAILIAITLIVISTAGFIVCRLIQSVHYKRFAEAEIGSSLEQVREKTGGNYENGVLTVSANKKEIYIYKFESGKLAEKYHHYLGSSLGSDVNYENFCRANAAMTLSELEEIFGKSRLISQNEQVCEYLWMENPLQFVVFRDSADSAKTLLSSLMPNPKQNTEPITLNAVNSLSIPSSVEELENKLGAAVTVFRQRLNKDGRYEYGCYIVTENTEYVIFLDPGNYVTVDSSFLNNIIDLFSIYELYGENNYSLLLKKITYTETVNIFGTEGFLTAKTSEYTTYSWVANDLDTLISVRFDQSGYIIKLSRGSINRVMLLSSPFSNFSKSWDVPAFLRY